MADVPPSKDDGFVKTPIYSGGASLATISRAMCAVSSLPGTCISYIKVFREGFAYLENPSHGNRRLFAKSSKDKGLHQREMMKEIMSIDANELQEILDVTPLDQAIMLIGDKGIGKSQILTEFHEKKGIRVQSFFLGQLSDPGDVIGLPRKNEKSGITEYLAPFWWPVDGEPVALFFDEMNKARNEILNAIQDCVLNHTLMGRPLPEGSRVIAAVNWGENYDVNDLDEAMLSRFNIYRFQPTVAEWLDYARSKGVDERIIGFIREKEIYLDSSGKDQQNEEVINSPDRRAWFKVDNLIRGRDPLPEACWKAITGQVGVSAQSAFRSFVETRQRSIPVKEVLFNFGEETRQKLQKLEMHDLVHFNKEIMAYLQISEPDEAVAVVIARGISGYMDYLAEAQLYEVLADFTSLSREENLGLAMIFAADFTLFKRMQDIISQALVVES